MAVSAPAGRSAPVPAVRRPLFLVGVAMALLAFILVLVLGVVIAGRAAAGTVQVTVVVAAQNVAHRQVITPGALTTARLPAAAVPPAAILQAADAVGKVAQVDVLKGQPITANLVAAGGTGQPAYLPIAQGWVAVAIPASELQAVGGYVAVGDAIDIEASVNETTLSPAARSSGQLTKTVLGGVHVLEVGPPRGQGAASGAQAGQPLGVASSLTVLLTPCDAQYLTWLIANGSVRYALRSPKDYGSLPTGPDPSCPPGASLGRVGPAEVDARFGFTR